MGNSLRPLRILLVEAAECEVRPISSALRRGGYTVLSQRVETVAQMQNALYKQTWDVVLCSYTLPQFSAIEALNLLQDRGLNLPFIVLFDRFEEIAAVEIIKAGAHDCLLKGHLKRLVPTVMRALHEVEIQQQMLLTEAMLLQLTVEELIDRRLTATLAYEFLTTLNHELRTPLTSLQAAIELLQTGRLGTLSERGQHLLDIAARSTDRLVHLTNQMLDPEASASTSTQLNRFAETARER